MRRLVLAGLLLCVAGCAAPTATPMAAAGPAKIFPIYFKEWSAALDDPANAVIGEAAAFAAAHPAGPVRVIGYADQTGSRAANQLLGGVRAQVVSDALMQKGVADTRLVREAGGSTPFALNSLESRRVEISVGQ